MVRCTLSARPVSTPLHLPLTFHIKPIESLSSALRQTPPSVFSRCPQPLSPPPYQLNPSSHFISLPNGASARPRPAELAERWPSFLFKAVALVARATLDSQTIACCSFHSFFSQRASEQLRVQITACEVETLTRTQMD